MKKDRVFIRLSDIPEEGREFTYDRTTKEFDQVLKDLIDENPYSINFFIRPVGNVHEVTGRVSTNLTRLCSKCGEDFSIKVDSKIHEILMPKVEEAKGDTQTKSGSIPETNELSVTYVVGGILNAENMIHEIVAIADPPYPICGKVNCDADIQAKIKELENAAELALRGQLAAFDVLKSLKLQ